MNEVATIDENKPLSIGAELKSKESQFQAALPAHIPVERFMRVVMTAIQNNPSLLHANRRSLWNSSIRAAQDGLLPDGREGALVIYRTKDKDDKGKDIWIEKVQWMPMIAGVRKKVRNSGEIITWDAHVVHQKDQFEFELGDDPFIKHKPFLEGEPGPVVAAYSIATLKGGEKSREVMTRPEIEKVRAASKSKDKGPWVEWFEEMCRKTVARRHSKVLPMSTDLDDLLRRDDDLYDFQGARNEAKVAAPQSLSAKLDALANFTPHEPEMRDDAPLIENEPDAQAAPITEEAQSEEPISDAQEAPGDGEKLLDEARSQSLEGRRSFDVWWNSRTEEQVQTLLPHMKSLMNAANSVDRQTGAHGK